MIAIYLFCESYFLFVILLFIFLYRDFNEDDHIDENDLKAVLKRLCGSQKLSQDSINTIVLKVSAISNDHTK